MLWNVSFHAIGLISWICHICGWEGNVGRYFWTLLYASTGSGWKFVYFIYSYKGSHICVSGVMKTKSWKLKIEIENWKFHFLENGEITSLQRLSKSAKPNMAMENIRMSFWQMHIRTTVWKAGSLQKPSSICIFFSILPRWWIWRRSCSIQNATRWLFSNHVTTLCVYSSLLGTKLSKAASPQPTKPPKFLSMPKFLRFAYGNQSISIDVKPGKTLGDCLIDFLRVGHDGWYNFCRNAQELSAFWMRRIVG